MPQYFIVFLSLVAERRSLSRSIYQDIPLYTQEEFMERAPEDMRTEEIVENEHALMTNRLNFELAERQRCAAALLADHGRMTE